MYAVIHQIFYFQIYCNIIEENTFVELISLKEHDIILFLFWHLIDSGICISMLIVENYTLFENNLALQCHDKNVLLFLLYKIIFKLN